MLKCFIVCSLPQNPGSYITIDNMSVFNTPRKFVRSLEQQSSSKNTCRKLQSRGELAEANHGNLNAIDWNMNLSPVSNGTVNESMGGDNRHMITKANHDNLNAMEYNSVNGKHSNETSMGMYFQI